MNERYSVTTADRLHEIRPPEDNSHRLATLPRSNGKGGTDELRIGISEYAGHPYIQIRLWTVGTGGHWPSKTGVSVRRSELDSVIDALVQARDMLEGTDAATTTR